MIKLYRSAFTALQSIITNFPSLRERVVMGFAMFVLREIPDNCPLVLENALKTLLQFISHWKGLITNQEVAEKAEKAKDIRKVAFYHFLMITTHKVSCLEGDWLL